MTKLIRSQTFIGDESQDEWEYSIYPHSRERFNTEFAAYIAASKLGMIVRGDY